MISETADTIRDMNHWRQLMAQHGLGQFVDEIERIWRPSCRLVPTKSKGSRNQLGGKPNLPAGFKWPKWNGQSLAFIAQLDLASLPASDDLTLPPTGSLYFFYEGTGEIWGFDPKDRGAWSVHYSETPLIQCASQKFPSDYDEELEFQPVRLTVESAESTVPDTNAFALLQLAFTQEQRSAYRTVMKECSGEWTDKIHRLGGFPQAVQGDPFMEGCFASNGHYCGDPTGYKAARAAGLEAKIPEWRLLLQVDSEDEYGMMWGDLGRLYFMIHKDDLKARRFEKCWMTLQCS